MKTMKTKRFETEEKAISYATKIAKRSKMIDTTGDVVTGDEIVFVRGNWERVAINRHGKLAWRFTSFDVIRAKVVADSYGSKKQQHTFTLEKRNGEKMLIKGRNLYRFVVFRKRWRNERDREHARAEKHARGSEARARRAERIASRFSDDYDFYTDLGPFAWE